MGAEGYLRFRRAILLRIWFVSVESGIRGSADRRIPDKKRPDEPSRSRQLHPEFDGDAVHRQAAMETGREAPRAGCFHEGGFSLTCRGAENLRVHHAARCIDYQPQISRDRYAVIGAELQRDGRMLQGIAPERTILFPHGLADTRWLRNRRRGRSVGGWSRRKSPRGTHGCFPSIDLAREVRLGLGGNNEEKRQDTGRNPHGNRKASARPKGSGLLRKVNTGNGRDP